MSRACDGKLIVVSIKKTAPKRRFPHRRAVERAGEHGAAVISADLVMAGVTEHNAQVRVVTVPSIARIRHCTAVHEDVAGQTHGNEDKRNAHQQHDVLALHKTPSVSTFGWVCPEPGLVK